MGQELVNVLRVSAVTPDGINVELPEYPLADAQLPPGFKGLAAGRDGPRWDPRLPIEELIGVKPVSASLVALGVPQAVRLTAAPAWDTTGLADFVARDIAAHFFLIHLVRSITRPAVRSGNGPSHVDLGTNLAARAIRCARTGRLVDATPVPRPGNRPFANPEDRRRPQSDRLLRQPREGKN